MSSLVVLYSSTVRYTLMRITIQAAVVRRHVLHSSGAVTVLRSSWGIASVVKETLMRCISLQRFLNLYIPLGRHLPKLGLGSYLLSIQNSMRVSGGGYGWKDWNCHSACLRLVRPGPGLMIVYLSPKRQDAPLHVKKF